MTKAQRAIILPTEYAGLYEVAVRTGTTYSPLSVYGVLTKKHALQLIEELFGSKVSAAARTTADECGLD